MNFLKSNYKMILVIFVSVVVQVVVVLMLLNPSDKEKKEIDSTIAKQDTNTIFYDDDEIDAIDQSKIDLINGTGLSVSKNVDENSETEEIEESVSQVGKVDVHVGYTPTVASENKAKKTTSSYKAPIKNTNKENNNTDNKTNIQTPVKNSIKDDKKKVDSVDSVEKVEKTILGKWKSENDSDGRKSDMYWEFFKDGTYQNYDGDRSIVFNGKYTVNSANLIKIDQENVYLSATGNTRKQNEVFSVDINFKDEKSFSVTDIDHFDFTDYKKVK